MDIETKSWNYLGTGTRVHFFLNGQALCRSSYTKAPSVGDMDYCEAVQRTLGIPGTRVCPTCEKKFNEGIERLENSMQPSTGEGDYLPPAETAPVETCCEHAPMYHGARGCDECGCTNPRQASKRAVVKPDVSNEVIEALRTIRNQPGRTSEEALANVLTAFDVLDNAGIFSAIDEATDYDTDPAPEQISECTCPTENVKFGGHLYHCPGYPAERGDMVFGPVRTAVDNIRSAVGLKF